MTSELFYNDAQKKKTINTFVFGVPGVAVPPGIFVSPIPWPVLPFVADVLNVDTDD